MIREAVTNLIDNAMKHGGAGLSEITVGLEAAPDSATIVVRDDGKGLSEAQIQTALQRFGQVSERSDGSGLGLPIVERVADRHGGGLKLRGGAPGLEVRFTIAR